MFWLKSTKLLEITFHLFHLFHQSSDHSHIILKIIPSTSLGPVNGKNIQASIEFLELNLKNRFLSWQIDPDLKSKLFSSMPSFFMSFRGHKNI